jgi:hypothetical protein
VLKEKPIQLILPGLSQRVEIEMMNLSIRICFRIIDELGNQGMNVRIPFQISAESMQSGNHPEYFLIFKVAIEISVIFVVSDLTGSAAFSLFPAVDILVKHLTDSVAGSDEEEIQSRPVFAEEGPVVFGNCEYHMTVRDIQAHDFSLGRKLFLILDTAGVTNTGMAFAEKQHFVTTLRTFKAVIPKIDSIA